MTSDQSLYSEATYREVIEVFSADPNWELKDDPTQLNSTIEAVGNGSRSVGEARYTHQNNGATLIIQFPDRRTGDVAEVLLDFPLDHRIPSSEAGFIGKLCGLHQTIAESHETSYIEPLTSASAIAKVHIPDQFSAEQLHTTVAALDAIAQDLASVHEELHNVLDSY